MVGGFFWYGGFLLCLVLEYRGILFGLCEYDVWMNIVVVFFVYDGC